MDSKTGWFLWKLEKPVRIGFIDFLKIGPSNLKFSNFKKIKKNLKKQESISRFWVKT
jgi:hypothetical protein